MNLHAWLRTYAGAFVVGAAASAALMHSRPTPLPPGLHALGEQEARELYVAAADAEVEARKKAGGRFRGSLWSQDDEFHSKEARFLRTYARAHRLEVPTLIDALDRGMHAHWATPDGRTPDQKVLPCRPRLNY